MKGKLLSHIRLLATPWTAAYQAPSFIGFSRQEYWSGVPLPSPTTLQLNNSKLRKQWPPQIKGRVNMWYLLSIMCLFKPVCMDHAFEKRKNCSLFLVLSWIFRRLLSRFSFKTSCYIKEKIQASIPETDEILWISKATEVVYNLSTDFMTLSTLLVAYLGNVKYEEYA